MGPAEDLHVVVVLAHRSDHLLDALAVHRPPGQVAEPEIDVSVRRKWTTTRSRPRLSENSMIEGKSRYLLTLPFQFWK